ncbi:MAG: hypothetical protein UW51_C0006G0168 [Candidatus Amesbacteria bacterium GW2011_GWA1_44_24]|nr:MAG: hypothetical protein UW51_C0006G0168 [Candidatus Amesbacteria bacterium GW2011_GWA1_44_24]
MTKLRARTKSLRCEFKRIKDFGVKEMAEPYQMEGMIGIAAFGL